MMKIVALSILLIVKVSSGRYCSGNWVARYWSPSKKDHRYVAEDKKPPKCSTCVNWQQGDYILEDATYFCDIGGSGFPNMAGWLDGDLFEFYTPTFTDSVYLPWSQRQPYIDNYGYQLQYTGAPNTDLTHYFFLFHCWDWARPGSVKLHRLYSLANTDHFYTYDEAEKTDYINNRGYKFEFTVCWVYKDFGPSSAKADHLGLIESASVVQPDAEPTEMVTYAIYLIIFLLFLNTICYTIYWFKNQNGGSKQYKVVSMDTDTDI